MRFQPAGTVKALDYETLSAAEWTEEEIAARVREVASTPFRLESDPILRVRVLELASAHILVLCTHHIACDLWSLVVMLDDLARFYKVAAAGKDTLARATDIFDTLDVYASDGDVEDEEANAVNGARASSAALPLSSSAYLPMCLASGKHDEALSRKLLSLFPEDGTARAHLQYHDYVMWQRQWLLSPKGEEVRRGGLAVRGR